METQNILIAHPSSENELGIIKAFFKALKIKFEIADENNYNNGLQSLDLKSKLQSKKEKMAIIDDREINTLEKHDAT
jgi:hypothetical protein